MTAKKWDHSEDTDHGDLDPGTDGSETQQSAPSEDVSVTTQARRVPARPSRLLTAVAVLLVLATLGAGFYTYRLAKLRTVPQTLADVSIRAQQEAIKKDPKNVALYLGLADLYYSAKAYDQALAALNTLEKSKPAPDPMLLALSAYGKGKIAYATGDKEKALTEYQGSLEITETAEANLALGSLYLERKEYESAITNLSRYSELMPSDGEAIVQLAKAYEGAGKTAEALQAYERAATYLKDDKEIMAAIARLKGQQ